MRAQVIPESPARVEFTVQFSHGPKGRRRAREASDHLAPGKAPDRVSKITRLLVLGHHFERLVRDGVVKDYAEIARLTGLTRARITQIMNLTLLAPDIQEMILFRVGHGPKFAGHERQIRRVVANQEWAAQRRTLGTGNGKRGRRCSSV